MGVDHDQNDELVSEPGLNMKMMSLMAAASFGSGGDASRGCSGLRPVGRARTRPLSEWRRLSGKVLLQRQAGNYRPEGQTGGYGPPIKTR